MNSIEKLTELYGFSKINPKWGMVGSEILKYIGENVMFIQYTKNKETNTWSNITNSAKIIGIGNYNMANVSYEVVYQLDGSDELITSHILPEGYSYNSSSTSDEDTTVFRFVPYSKHFMYLEEETFYSKLPIIFEKKSTLPIDFLKALSTNINNADSILGYQLNIVAVIKTVENTMLQFRIKTLSCTNVLDNIYSITITDFEDNSYSLDFDSKTGKNLVLKVGDEIIGDLKIINLAD